MGQRIGDWIVAGMVTPHELEVRRASDAAVLGTLVIAPELATDADWADAIERARLTAKLLDAGNDGALRFYVIARVAKPPFAGPPSYGSPLRGIEKGIGDPFGVVAKGLRLDGLVEADTQPHRAPTATGPVAMGAEVEAPAQLYWNVHFPRDAGVTASRVLLTNIWYAFEAGLSSVAAADSLSRQIAAARDVVGVDVVYSIAATNAQLRRPGSTDAPGDALESAPQRCTATGTAPFAVEVQATGAGPVTLTAALLVGGAVMLREVVSLVAVAVPGAEPPSAPTTLARTVAPPPAIALAGLETPPVALSLALAAVDGTYRFDVRVGATRDRPVDSRRAVVDVAAQVNIIRRRLVALSQSYQDQLAPADDFAGLRLADGGAMLLAFAKHGRDLHGLLFGRAAENVTDDLKRVAGVLRDLGRDGSAPRVQIDAPSAPIPWGVLYDAPGPLATPADVDPLGFWGRRFAIDRLATARIAAVRRPVVAGDVQACLNPGIDAEQKVTAVANERAFFADDLKAAPPIVALDGLRAYFQRADMPPNALLYFFCHALAAKVEDVTLATQLAIDQAQLGFGPGADLSVRDLEDLRATPLAGNPLVFLNACESSRGDPSYQSEFLTLFVDTWQAAGFIGTDWTVPTVFADAFARRALRRFLVERLPIGEAFCATTRDVLALGNPFPLIYALYVRPELSL